METKSLLIGILSFISGALLVSTAAVTFNKPEANIKSGSSQTVTEADSLKHKTGDDFDRAFISHMIEHHEGAVDVARLSRDNAKHDEIKQLSADIIAAQEKEIAQMKQWQVLWGYDNSHQNSSNH